MLSPALPPSVSFPGAADQVLDVDQLVRARPDGVLDTVKAEVDHHARRSCIAGGVAANAATQDIVASTADENIIPVTAVEIIIAAVAVEAVVSIAAHQHVGAARSCQHVVEIRASQVLEPRMLSVPAPSVLCAVVKARLTVTPAAAPE